MYCVMPNLEALRAVICMLSFKDLRGIASTPWPGEGLLRAMDAEWLIISLLTV